MKPITILWVDDEIDLLKPHIIFLESKGYQMKTANNGNDAIEMVEQEKFDLVLLDENMPGLTGLETLEKVKSISPSLPVVMITKSEEEYIMDEAIGSKISDYLIKPVNPKQIMMSIKKIIDQKRLVSEKTTSSYQAEFGRLGMMLNDNLDMEEWKEVYKKLTYWELALEENSAEGMGEVFGFQKVEANNAFIRYVEKNYTSWFSKSANDVPTHSASVFKRKLFPLLKAGKQVVVVLIDNLRFDQWKSLEPLFSDFYTSKEEDLFCSILPTATQFARNAMFAGLMPSDIEKIHPEYWVNEDEEEGKNAHEKELLNAQLSRYGIDCSLYYAKAENIDKIRKIRNSMGEILNHQLSVLVVNFVDMLSHARTEMQMIKELAADESAYRSITKSWFEHSALYELIKELSGKNIELVITTDHGSKRVQNPVKVVGDKNTSTNLRYKHGKSLNYKKKEVFEITRPEDICLPKLNVSSSYIFAKGDDFLAYPNNYNHYVGYYKNTFQHGGISIEEMMCPYIHLSPKE
jgi:DNA-binding response OmpR family regulator